MKRTIGILLLVVGVALGIYGFSKYDKNTADVKIGDLEISAGDKGGQQQSYLIFGLAAVGVIAGIAMMAGSKGSAT